jgi:hypothetical protein
MSHERREDGEIVCTVLDGREALRECPELQARIDHHGIKLYGVNAPPIKGPLRFRR